MSELQQTFLQTKKELLEESLKLIDKLNISRLEARKEVPSFDKDDFIKSMISIQSKISILGSIGSLEAFRGWSNIEKWYYEILKLTYDINNSKNTVEFVSNTGYLVGYTMRYLYTINSLRFDLKKKRFTFNFDKIPIAP